MANIGYRRFNGSTDKATFTLGNVASQSSLDCWIFAGRLVSSTADGEVISAPGYDPLDWYYRHTSTSWALYDGATDSGAGSGNPSWTPAEGFVIVAVRRVASTAVRWSKAVYSGGAWGSFTHSTGSNTFGNRTYPSSGNFIVADTPLNMDVALIARCTSASDANINTLTTNLAAWQALPNLTNLWRFDAVGGANGINDLKGTSTQSSITGTSVTAAGFPLDAGGGSVALTAADSFVAVSCDTAALTQHHVLTVSDSTVAVSCDTGTLTQHQILTADDSAIAVVCDSATLAASGQLAADDSTITVTCTTGELVQHHALAAADATMPVSCTTATLTAHGAPSLVAADCTITITSTSGTLVQHHVLTAQDSAIAVSCTTASFGAPARILSPTLTGREPVPFTASESSAIAASEAMLVGREP